ncbi:HFR024Wp [Eremothecium sinecaudum]|uniref:HFR024Wp n=1 Tax=Eremothecium sinecaudum TaxID=45286 RepID=A0A0X8HUX3_9SACH|nr:HFR024Wp [Eremothecium sinecaudum]AMD21879.1 HFR024Wp [Eremothecium sinecaudum]
MNVQDRKRILGPNNAKAIKFDLEPTQANATPSQDIEHQERSVFIQDGLVINANGSSYLEYKDTSHHALLITSVYGPRPIRGSFTSKAALTVQFKQVTYEKWNTGEITEFCNFLKNVFNSVIRLDKYLKSGIDISLNLIQYSATNDERDLNLASILPYCINGITVALVNAGIEIADLASAGKHEDTIVAFIKNGEEIVGFWHDSQNCEIPELIDACREDYFKQRDSIVAYLMSKTKDK